MNGLVELDFCLHCAAGIQSSPQFYPWILTFLSTPRNGLALTALDAEFALHLRQINAAVLWSIVLPQVKVLLHHASHKVARLAVRHVYLNSRGCCDINLFFKSFTIIEA